MERPDALVDATALSHSLGFVARALPLGLPTCLTVTMTDEPPRRDASTSRRSTLAVVTMQGRFAHLPRRRCPWLVEVREAARPADRVLFRRRRPTGLSCV